MSKADPKAEGEVPGEDPPGSESGEPAGSSQPAEEEMSAEEQQAYNKMMSTLSKMNTKIEKVKAKLQGQQLAQKKTKTDQMTNKLISAKQNSQIITKENLLTDITETYEQVVIGIYSENSKLKKKIEQMTKIIHQQHSKIYSHTQKEKELQAENQRLREELLKMKDQRMLMARGQPSQAYQTEKVQQSSASKKKTVTGNQNSSQNEDFDFWSMPQNDYAKKKKDFVQDSSLWVNQREAEQSAFVTQEYGQASRKKK